MSFDLAEYTAEVDGVGTLRLLDAIRLKSFISGSCFSFDLNVNSSGRVAYQTRSSSTRFSFSGLMAIL